MIREMLFVSSVRLLSAYGVSRSRAANVSRRTASDRTTGDRNNRGAVSRPRDPKDGDLDSSRTPPLTIRGGARKKQTSWPG